MTSIGGKIGRRSFATPDNQGMVRKANARLESHIASANARLDNALLVDGVKILLWRQRPEGSGPVCSCHADVARKDRLAQAEHEGTDISQVDDGEDYEIVGFPANHDHAPKRTSANFDNPLDDIKFASSERARENGTDPLVGHPIDQLDFDEVEETTPGIAPANPLGSNTAQSVACPVCAGATYRDGWQPISGHRAVMSFLAADTYSSAAMLDDTTKPFSMVLEEGQELLWNIKLPRSFCEVVRLGLWSGRIPLEEDEYTPEVFDGIAWVKATPKVLLRMSNDKKFSFRFVAPRRVLITHFDCIVMLSDMAVGQFPPLNAPYDPEMREYLTNITIEVSASLNVAPGDALSDHKFFKMWRVTNAVRKFTAGNRSLSTALDLRIVTSTEAMFSLHPYNRYEEMGSKPFASKLETFQGNS